MSFTCCGQPTVVVLGRQGNCVRFDEKGRGIERVDLTGRPNGGPTPHAVEMVRASDGRILVREGKQARPARPDEIP